MITIVVVQARLNSSRLQRKILSDIAGKTMLARVLERANAIDGVDAVVLTAPEWDQLLGGDAEQNSETAAVLRVHHDPPDVLTGYVRAARAMKANVIVRITADCPLIAPDIAGRMLREFHGGGVDYLGTTRPALSLPDGLDVEIMSRLALESAADAATEIEDREHVTRFIYGRPQYYAVRTTHVSSDECPEWFRPLKLSVDVPEDLERVRHVYVHLSRSGGVLDFSIGATIRAAQAAEACPHKCA